MFMVMGRFSINPAEREQFLDFARNLIPVERTVKGCVGFEMFEDLLTPNSFLMIEQWEDEAALDAYTETDQYAEHDDTLNTFVVGEPTWDEYEF